MKERPAQPLDELIAQDPAALRVKLGLPHPLAQWGIDGRFMDGLFADIILDFIHDTVWERRDSCAYKGAVWFLLESEKAYYFACAEAGIDAERLRDHLRKKLP